VATGLTGAALLARRRAPLRAAPPRPATTAPRKAPPRPAVLALAAGLTLAACGHDGATDTVSAGSSSGEHGGGHSGGDKTNESAEDNAADVEFLTGMRPHHEQAIEMSDIVLKASPPAAFAAIARQIRAAQSPEIVQVDTMLEALGEETVRGAHDDRPVGMIVCSATAGISRGPLDRHLT
jgi:uncharacterized protein (DUF305 family)